MAAIRRRLADDAGTSLMELIVGMAIMSIFMAMFTGAIWTMYGTVNKVESVTDSQAQVNQAFLTLDKKVRYASAISTPGVSATSAGWYVELLSTYTGTNTCTQLRMDPAGKKLLQRTWTVVNSTDANVSGWLPLASGLTNGSAAANSATQPFVLTAAPLRATVAFPRLTVTLVATAGTSSATTSKANMTFTLINSASTSATSICQGEGRP